jgi:hypothetical protein
VNNRPGIIHESPEQTKGILPTDPWIRRCDPLFNKDSIYQSSQKQSIQYETRPYYCSLSSTSDDCLSQPPQHRPALINTVDKDIEYVESRLRGQTTVSLPNADSTNHINWRQIANENYANGITLNNQKYSNPTSKLRQSVETISSPRLTVTAQKSQPNESVKTVKRRIEKMKDQKAARTLRYKEKLLSNLFSIFYFSVLFSLLLL